MILEMNKVVDYIIWVLLLGKTPLTALPSILSQ